MALTQVQVEAKITALESALGSGALRVEFADRVTQYRSTDELLKALAYFKGLLVALTGGRAKQHVAVASSGFATP